MHSCDCSRSRHTHEFLNSIQVYFVTTVANDTRTILSNLSLK